jgi:hypothetical protein
MTEITSAMGVLKRLSGSLLLLKLAETIIPRLVANGYTDHGSAEKVLGQVPSLRAEIGRQIEAVKEAMELIQDRVEAVAQFLLVHRVHLEPTEESEVRRLLSEVRA